VRMFVGTAAILAMTDCPKVRPARKISIVMQRTVEKRIIERVSARNILHRDFSIVFYMSFFNASIAAS